MAIQVTVELPESAFSALRTSPERFGWEMLAAAAVKWYELGRLSQSKACEVLGMSRQQFLQTLNRHDVSPFQTTPDELRDELSRG